VVLGTLDRSRMRARDTKRMEDLSSIRTALELYYTDHGRYPVIPVGQSWAGGGYWAFSHCFITMEPCGWESLSGFLVPTYISELPRDPKGPPTSVQNVRPWNASADRLNYGYLSVDGQTYDLVAKFEDSANPYRCELKQYKYHTGNSFVTDPTIAAETSWCPSGTLPLFYADH
jgi:hypothetical protein